MAIDKKWIKIINVSAIVLAWVFVIARKYMNPDMSLKIPIFISSIISIVALIILFGKTIKLNINKEEKTITKLGKEEILKIIEKEAHSRKNNLRPENPFPKKISDTINNNLIYAYWVKLNLDNESFVIIINASRPELEPTICDEFDEDEKEISDYKIKELMNKKSINPYKEPNREISEETIDQFGKPIRRTERITQKEEKTEEEEGNNV